jgi:hypothetical protein
MQTPCHDPLTSSTHADHRDCCHALRRGPPVGPRLVKHHLPWRGVRGKGWRDIQVTSEGGGVGTPLAPQDAAGTISTGLWIARGADHTRGTATIPSSCG